jgi:hypothetical protein
MLIETKLLFLDKLASAPTRTEEGELKVKLQVFHQANVILKALHPTAPLLLFFIDGWLERLSARHTQ